MAVGSMAVDVPFIGRVDELVVLRRLLDTALSGQPRVVLLSGDAGVGKSRLLAESMAAASAAHVRVLFGTCYEDMGIPYLPIATAFRPLDHEGARRLNPPRGSVVAGAPDADDAEGNRLSLFLDVTAALVDEAATTPTLLVLDDVHWADDASAELIRHLVLSAVHEASLAELPLMIILSARGPWPEGVPRALARLSREGAAVELRLERFGVVEAHAMVTALAGARPRTDVINELLDATAGNPLLLRAVVTRNLSAGHLLVHGDEVRLGANRQLSAPTDLDDEIRLELARLDDEGHTALSIAAVMGDGELTTALRAVVGASHQSALGHLFEAGILRADGTHHRFSHPQVRHVVYDDLDEDRRATIHLLVAASLENSAEHPDAATALAIAHHLRRGGADPNDEHVAQWALVAGEGAWSSGAWEEATRAYSMALAGAARSTLPPEELTEVLVRAGVAAYYANDDMCTTWLGEAAELAASLGDVERRARALLVAARFRLIGTAATVGARAPIDELEALLPLLDEQLPLRALVLATIADLHVVGLDQERAAASAQLAEEALELGGRDSEAAGQVTFTLGLQDMSSLRLAEATRHFRRVIEVGEPHVALAAKARIGLIHLVEGKVDEAEVMLDEARTGERRLSSHAGQQLPAASLAAVHYLRGRFAEVEHLAAEVQSLYEIQEYAFTPGILFPTLAASRVARGDVDGAREALGRWQAAGGRGVWRYDALLATMTGGTADVASELRSRRWPSIVTPNLFTLDIPCLHVLVGVAMDDLDLVRSGLPALATAHEHGLLLTLGWPWLLSRVLGDGNLAVGQVAAAERWYQRARDEVTAVGASIEQAYVTLGEAGLERSRGHSTRAATLAARAAADLDAASALLLARDAREVIDHDGGVVAPPPRQRFILFTDIVGSTELNVRAGDIRYLSLAEEHDRILRARFRRHDGVEHAHTGDGMSAWFATADAALDCAFGVQADLERASIAHPELPVRVRVGISVGRPLLTGERLFGISVVEAARICGLAGSGQVLVSEEVQAQATGPYPFRLVGEHHLKGLPGSQTIHEALHLGTG